MAYTEQCDNCGGTGVYHYYFRPGYETGGCFYCKGSGVVTLKTSPEVRAKAKARRDAKKREQLRIREERAIEAAYRGHYTLHLYSLARASREALKPPKAPVPAGRVEVIGTVISTRVERGDWGTQFKALIEDDRGFRLWGNLPSAIWDAEKGERVTFVAALTASRDDEFFGFWKRPTKAEFINAQEAA